MARDCRKPTSTNRYFGGRMMGPPTRRLFIRCHNRGATRLLCSCGFLMVRLGRSHWGGAWNCRLRARAERPFSFNHQPISRIGFRWPPTRSTGASSPYLTRAWLVHISTALFRSDDAGANVERDSKIPTWLRILGTSRKNIDTVILLGQDFASENHADRTDHDSSEAATGAGGAGARPSQTGGPARWSIGGQSRNRSQC
jgi:hypothetical protein